MLQSGAILGSLLKRRAMGTTVVCEIPSKAASKEHDTFTETENVLFNLAVRSGGRKLRTQYQ